MFSGTKFRTVVRPQGEPDVSRLKQALAQAEAVVIGAGAGLSTSAGFVYSGERFERYFADFGRLYGFVDMYSGGFFDYPTQEAFWAYWSRYIWVNRYLDPPEPVYDRLLALVRDKDYFVITTNVDHCFQKAGFDKQRLFYTQGDYGLFQCSEPCHQKTYDNEAQVRAMCAAQGFDADGQSELINRHSELVSESQNKENVAEMPKRVRHDTLMKIPTDLIPHCPVCGKPMTMNLRADDTFVQDEGWYEAAERYENFLRTRRAADGGKVLFLELGVGSNTPGIIKYPFWQMTAQNPNATYACVNYGEAVCPREIADRAICVNADIGEVLDKMKPSDGGTKKESA